MSLFRLPLCMLLALASFSTQAANITVAVASNFTEPMKEIVARYNEVKKDSVRVVINSSGKLYAQIHHGAPFDIFLSADQAKPAKLSKEGLAQAGSQFTYATGRLAFWSHKHDLIDKDGTAIKQHTFKKVAVANAKLAPYGLAAEQTLRSLGELENYQPLFIRGENISQTYQFVLTENADAGFVALSQIMRNGKITTGSSWVVPAQLHDPINQDAVIINRSRTKQEQQAVNAFFTFLKSEKVAALIQQFGYSAK